MDQAVQFFAAKDGCLQFDRPRAVKLVESVATICFTNLVVLVQSGERILDLRLRVVGKPDKDIAVGPAHLGLKPPTGLKLVQNVVEKPAEFYRKSLFAREMPKIAAELLFVWVSSIRPIRLH